MVAQLADSAALGSSSAAKIRNPIARESRAGRSSQLIVRAASAAGREPLSAMLSSRSLARSQTGWLRRQLAHSRI